MFDKSEIITRMSRDTFAVETTGIEIVDLEPGYAKTRVLVQDKHLNALGITQGGVLFTLADFALALVSNTHPDMPSVGIEGDISYIRASKAGEVLTAEAREIARTRAFSTTEVTITNEQGELLAKFHGRTYTPQRPHKSEPRP